MKAKTYVKNVLITESNDFQKIGERLASPRSIRMLHGILGLCTEATELFEMLEKKKLDLTNLKEEVSDSHWYLGIIIDEYKLKAELLIQDPAIDPAVKSKGQRVQLNHHIDKLTKHVGLIQDLVKKHLFYGRDLDMAKIEAQIKEIAIQLSTLCAIGKIPLEESLKANIMKLRARFKGKFSEARANTRNLKKERSILERKGKK